ncbi:MAG: SdpA family antimicrobial peptide system protein [Saprospiraceae bacterium]|nr:SdpA family antimicrobial peptide system protein [Saprospiraceae bacterium]
MSLRQKIAIYTVALVVTAVWSSFIFKVAISSLPHGAFHESQVAAFNLKNVMPQGWGFFTRNPREDNYFVFRLSPDGKQTPVLTYSNSLNNMFGIKRTSRIQSMEMGAIVQRLKEYDWFDCPLGNNLCQDDIAALCPTPVLNTCPKPTLCGELFITLKEVVPWAWGSDYSTLDMPAKTIKINAICFSPALP